MKHPERELNKYQLLSSQTQTKMDTDDNHMAENNLPKIKHKMGSTVLDSFTKLTNNKENDRVDGAISLLRHLLQPNSEGMDGKELQYAMTRLVRGMGTSRIAARKGFFTALTTFLTINSTNEVSRILQLLGTELRVVGSNSKSEEGDIYTGQILVCGALIHSKILLTSTLEEQQKVLTLLLTAGKKRSYLSCASYSFIMDLIEQLEEKDFKTIVWPILKGELAKPWAEQTLDTLRVLLVISARYPAVVHSTFLKNVVGSENVIDETSVTPISTLLLDLPMILSLQNPVYKLFSERLASTEYVPIFWNTFDQLLVTPTRNKMLVALQVATFVLSEIKDVTVVPSLITPNFLQNVIRTVTVNKKNRNDEVVLKFNKFVELLVLTMKRDDVKPKTQITVLRKLVLYPGDILIEKKTGTKVIQLLTTSLNAEGVKKLSKIYREITAVTKPKETSQFPEAWTNVERIYAAQMLTRLMNHSAITVEHDWRLEQLKFLFQLGICQAPAVGVELGALLKECFYRALDLKLSKLDDLRSILSSIVHYIDAEAISGQKLQLRVPLEEAATNVWIEMMAQIKILESNPKIQQAAPIFHTMELHMGLQLFSEPEMAISSIKDLHSCYERIGKKKKQSPEDEPEWVEVVIDLMLSLLSRSSHLLRSIVGCVFPHLCPMLTATSIHQILDVLDPKNSKSPLSYGKAEDFSSDESSGESDVGDEDEGDDKTEDQDKEMMGSSEEDISDSDPDDDPYEEDESVNDKLRMAVRQALGDAMAQTDDEDVDVDQINEEEGQRLDYALASAFKVLRENRQSRKKKQGKSAQALTHFRIRVVDLLEIYLDTNPSLALILDILLPLFALLEFSIKEQHQKPLENRIRSCLKKLSAVKKFSTTDEVTSDLLTSILKALIDKGSKSAPVYHEMADKLTECCTFLVRCSPQIDANDDSISNIYADILGTFFKKRDCVLPPMLFKSVLNLQWIGNWKLAPLLVEFAFDITVRPFRRNQALEFLDTFFHNNRLIQADASYTKIRRKVEKNISNKSVELLNELGQKTNSGTTQSIKQKFVCLLLSLLYTIKHQRQPGACDWEAIGAAMVCYRSNNTLAKDAKTAYNRLASQLGIPVNVQSSSIQKKEGVTENGQHVISNGTANDVESPENESDGDSEVKTKLTKKEKKKKQKIKGKHKDKQLLKREARELRMRAMSDGLDSVNFSTVPVHYINDVNMELADTDLSQNGKDFTEGLSESSIKAQSGIKISPKKRSSSESRNIPFNSSKKKKQV